MKSTVLLAALMVLLASGTAYGSLIATYRCTATILEVGEWNPEENTVPVTLQSLAVTEDIDGIGIDFFDYLNGEEPCEVILEEVSAEQADSLQEGIAIELEYQYVSGLVPSPDKPEGEEIVGNTWRLVGLTQQ